MDPRDGRDDADWFEVVSSENGVFGCVGLMACHDVCPKDLPLLEVYAYLRRKMLSTGVGKRSDLLQINSSPSR
jgi:fumarate reductase iron-sulfur subunit